MCVNRLAVAAIAYLPLCVIIITTVQWKRASSNNLDTQLKAQCTIRYCSKSCRSFIHSFVLWFEIKNVSLLPLCVFPFFSSFASTDVHSARCAKTAITASNGSALSRQFPTNSCKNHSVSIRRSFSEFSIASLFILIRIIGELILKIDTSNQRISLFRDQYQHSNCQASI